MLKRVSLVLLFAAIAASAWASGIRGPSLTIDAGKSAGKVSPTLYGLMTEGINHSYDGGLYAELIRNRAFLDSPINPVHWSVVQGGGAKATIEIDPKQPLDKAIPVSLKLDVTSATQSHPAGFANGGFWGIAVRPHSEYHASFYAKAAPGFSGPVTASIESASGGTVYAKTVVSGLTQKWKKYTFTLHTGSLSTTSKARYVLSLNRPGTVWFSLVSLFPPTWDNQKNGFRKNIMQMLVNLKPKFLRFPGGNFLEGQTIANRFNWKKTIGPLKNRPGHEDPWGYRSTDGLGLLDFLKWCQDMHAQPVLAVYAGYSLDGEYVQPGPKLEPYVKSALEEIQYVTGPVTSKWGAQRAKDGHPKPFKLHYVEVGNEDFFDKSGSYNQRFAQFYKAIKAKYPNIQVISTIGHEHPNMMVHSVSPDVLDQHYYLPAKTFIKRAPNYFKDYNRSGPKIFIGEWASYGTPFPPWNPQSRNQPPTGDMKDALGDAAWMTAMERNSNLVIMQCYAPLFVNVSPGARQWRPDLIGYNALHVFGSPSYYAIRMFSTNVGNQILKVTPKHTKVLSSVTRESSTGEIYIKMVNPSAKPVRIHIRLDGIKSVAPTAEAITLTAPLKAHNTITDRKKVVPVDSTVDGVKTRFAYRMPKHSVVVLKLKQE